MKSCCICYEDFENLVPLECKHEFCESCIDSIINHSCSLKCALCRKPSYLTENEKLNTKLFNAVLYGPSYIYWEMNNKKYSFYSLIHLFYWYYVYRHPYTYDDRMIRCYKCKI